MAICRGWMVLLTMSSVVVITFKVFPAFVMRRAQNSHDDLKHLCDFEMVHMLSVPIGNPARECLSIRRGSGAVAVADLCQQAPRGNVMRTCMDG